MENIKIGLMGSIGIPNVGDEAILERNLSLLENIFSNHLKCNRLEVYVFSKDATFSMLKSKHQNIKVYAISYLHEFIFNNIDKIKDPLLLEKTFFKLSKEKIKLGILGKIIGQLDAFQFIGGGYICSYWPDMIMESWLMARLLKFYEVPYILTGQSFYLTNEFDKKVVKDIVENARFTDFRDKDSLKYLINSKAKLFNSVDDVIELPYKKQQLCEKKLINIIIHPWREYNSIIQEKLDTVIIPFLEKHLEIDPQLNCNVMAFSEEDFSLWENALEKHTVFDGRINFINCTILSTSQIKSLIAVAEYNITSRFHAAIFSLSAGVPVFSIYYDKYYYSKLNSAHILFSDKNLVKINELQEKNLENFYSRKQDIKKNIISKREEVKQLYNQKLEKIIDFYKGTKLQNILPAISVIIPVYNMGQYLSKCLDSILVQDLVNIEIVCINDGSTDNSQEILNEYAWKDSRIKVVQQKNMGVSKARNKGLKVAIGEYVFFLDPDDWLPDEKVFSDLYFAAEKHKVNICGGGFEECHDNQLITEWQGSASKYVFYKEGYVDYREYQYDYGWVRFIYKRSFLINNNLFLPELSFFEDPVFFVRVMHKAERFYALTRMSYCYRSGHHSYNLSYKKVLDLLDGLTQNIILAKQYNYSELLRLEVNRIKTDYAGQFAKYLLECKKDNYELIIKFNKLNKILGNETRIEYEIFKFIIDNLNYQVWISSSGKYVLKQAIIRKFKKYTKAILPKTVVLYLKNKIKK